MRPAPPVRSFDLADIERRVAERRTGERRVADRRAGERRARASRSSAPALDVGALRSLERPAPDRRVADRREADRRSADRRQGERRAPGHRFDERRRTAAGSIGTGTTPDQVRALDQTGKIAVLRTRRVRVRSVAGLVVATSALAIAVIVPIAWAAGRPSNEIQQLGAGTVVSLADSGLSTPSPDPGVSITGPPLVSSASSAAAPRFTGPRTYAAVPVRVTVPSLDIAAAVVPIGVQSRDELAVPEDIAQVGWYEYGAAPGGPSGSIVMSGHVDSAVQGLGAMWPLRNAAVGALVKIATADHRTLVYKVVAREEFHKTVVPLAKIFSLDGPSRLTLITCGGAFNEAIKSYDDNIVVTALPVDPAT